jgi:hypothetical protein
LQRYWAMRHHVRRDAYSEDLRKKIVEAVERGTPKAEAARLFGVGISSVKRCLARAKAGRSLAPNKRPGFKPKMDDEDGRDRQETLGGRPRGAPGGHAAPKARVRRAGGWCAGERLHGLADAQAAWVEPKKRRVGATERDEFLRAAWRFLVAGEIDAQRLVFVDECATNTSLNPLYAWSRRGERAYGEAPRN